VQLYKKISARRYIALTASVKVRIGSPTRSSADADNGLDAFVGQSRSKKHLESIPSKIIKNNSE